MRTRAPAIVSGSVALLLIATASLTATAALQPRDPAPPEKPAETDLEAPPVPTDTGDEEQDVPDQSVPPDTR